jgi:hypothetical protein
MSPLLPLLIATLLALSAAMIVLYPLLGLLRGPEEPRGAGLLDVAERERAARGALREVEFDYRLGNLADADYRQLRDRYEERALAALGSRYSCERALDTLIDRQLEALRLQDAPANATRPAAQTQAAPTKGKHASSQAQSKGVPSRRRRGGARA